MPDPIRPAVSYDNKPLWQRINWPQTMLVVIPPIVSGVGIATTKLQFKTLVWSIIYYIISLLGITAGYHRYYSHRAFKATMAYRIYITVTATAAIQGSVYFWVRDHRIHHRFTDTDKDPYNAKRGFLWSHIGWLIFKKDPSKLGQADMSDITDDPVVKFQHRYFAYLALFMGIFLPTAVAGVGWGDWRGGYFYAAMLRLVLSHHSIFSINSLVHWLGSATYDDQITARDNFLAALVTMGEGYHNFHHQFPQDYRSAIKIYQFDPTKWFIYTCYLLGLVYDLKVFPENEIKKGELLMAEKRLNSLRSTINWGVPTKSLPEYSMKEYKDQCKNKKRKWIVIESIIYDVSHFMSEHPGGEKHIQTYIGATDATPAFNGQIYNHSNAARNLLASIRVGKFQKN